MKCSPLAGRSGLAVACLTAVREVLGSNRPVGSCVYHKNHCDLQPWAWALCKGCAGLPVPVGIPDPTRTRVVEFLMLAPQVNLHLWAIKQVCLLWCIIKLRVCYCLKQVSGHCYCSNGIVRLMLLLLFGSDDVQNHN